MDLDSRNVLDWGPRFKRTSTRVSNTTGFWEELSFDLLQRIWRAGGPVIDSQSGSLSTRILCIPAKSPAKDDDAYKIFRNLATLLLEWGYFVQVTIQDLGKESWVTTIIWAPLILQHFNISAYGSYVASILQCYSSVFCFGL